MSNRTRSAVRRLFAWAVEENKIGANPVANVKPVFKKEVSRERVLEDHELRAFWQATAGDDHPWAPFLRTLLLTAQRRGETSTMRWRDLDLDSDEPVWSIPREFVKADRTHDVPLAPEVVALLKDLPRQEGLHVFTTGDGTAPISGFTLAKRRLDQKMVEIMREAAQEAGDDPEKVEIEPWRLHDLRRTAATGMAALAIQPVVLARVLNHSPGSVMGVTAIYNRFEYGEKKCEALTAWASRLMQIVSGESRTSGSASMLRTARDSQAATLKPRAGSPARPSRAKPRLHNAG